MGFLKETFSNTIEAFACGAKYHEGFENTRRYYVLKAVMSFMVFFAFFMLAVFIGMMLWNNVAVKYITVFKPMKSVVDFIGLMVLIMLLMPSCC